MKKLSTNARRVIHLLYQDKNDDFFMTSTQLPSTYFTTEVQEELISYGLIKGDDNNEFSLTSKAYDVIDGDNFIVVYPLSSEGNVTNYNNVLDTMSNRASRALWLAVMNKDFHKRAGKRVVFTMFQKLRESIKYFRGQIGNSIAKLGEYKRDIEQAQTEFDRQIDLEFSKIKDYTLSSPISFEENVQLIQVIDSKNGRFKFDDSEETEEHLINKGEFGLDYDQKYAIVKEWSRKSTVQPVEA